VDGLFEIGLPKRSWAPQLLVVFPYTFLQMKPLRRFNVFRGADLSFFPLQIPAKVKQENKY